MLFVRLLVALILFLPLCVHRVPAQSAALPQLQSADPFVGTCSGEAAPLGWWSWLSAGMRRGCKAMVSLSGSHQKPNAESLVRLCSLSKIMTTDLLVKLVADGHVSLSDPLQKFAPPNVTVPVRTVRGLSDRPITLRDLATHTSGLPREIAYPAGDAGHFTLPDYNFRWQWLPVIVFAFSPGTAARSSNIGFDLLADALSPLPANPTRISLPTGSLNPLGSGYDAEPDCGQCARLLIGAGMRVRAAIRRRLPVWRHVLDRERHDALAAIPLDLPGVPMHQDPAATATYIQAAQLRWTQGLAHAGVPTGIGLGWVHINQPDDATMVIEKTGGVAGFTTYIALNPARHIGIFVAATEGRHEGANIFRESNDLLVYLAGITSDSMEVAAKENGSDAGVRARVSRRITRTSVLAAVRVNTLSG